MRKMFVYILVNMLAVIALFVIPVVVSFAIGYIIWLSMQFGEDFKTTFTFVWMSLCVAPSILGGMMASFAYFDWAFGSESESVRFKRIKDGR